jgi:hypothetical protein
MDLLSPTNSCCRDEISGVARQFIFRRCTNSWNNTLTSSRAQKDINAPDVVAPSSECLVRFRSINRDNNFQKNLFSENCELAVASLNFTTRRNGHRIRLVQALAQKAKSISSLNFFPRISMLNEFYPDKLKHLHRCTSLNFEKSFQFKSETSR